VFSQLCGFWASPVSSYARENWAQLQNDIGSRRAARGASRAAKRSGSVFRRAAVSGSLSVRLLACFGGEGVRGRGKRAGVARKCWHRVSTVQSTARNP